jgi:hypothetical protein
MNRTLVAAVYGRPPITTRGAERRDARARQRTEDQRNRPSYAEQQIAQTLAMVRSRATARALA